MNEKLGLANKAYDALALLNENCKDNSEEKNQKELEILAG